MRRVTGLRTCGNGNNVGVSVSESRDRRIGIAVAAAGAGVRRVTGLRTCGSGNNVGVSVSESSNNSFRKSDLCYGVCVAEVLAAACAEPVFNVAFFRARCCDRCGSDKTVYVRNALEADTYCMIGGNVCESVGVAGHVDRDAVDCNYVNLISRFGCKCKGLVLAILNSNCAGGRYGTVCICGRGNGMSYCGSACAFEVYGGNGFKLAVYLAIASTIILEVDLIAVGAYCKD